MNQSNSELASPPKEEEPIGYDELDETIPIPASNTGPQKETTKSCQLSELPTDTRPNRPQRPEDLHRARYLNNGSIDIEKNKQQGEFKTEKKIKKATCWVTCTWIMTCWTPSFLLKACGKTNAFFFFRFILIRFCRHEG